MDFVTAVRTCLSKYVDFSGRARRSEFWWFYLAGVLAVAVGAALDLAVGTYPLFYGLAALATFLPTLAAGIRRLHDTGKSGVYILFGLIPLVGGIVLLVFFVQDSAPGANEHGPNPKTGEQGYGQPTGGPGYGGGYDQYGQYGQSPAGQGYGQQQ